MIFLAKHPLVDNYDLSCLNTIYSGAAPLSLDIQNEIIKRISKSKPLQILQGYGMTELCFVSTCRGQESEDYMSNSVGNVICGMSAKVSCILCGIYSLNHEITLSYINYR